MDFNNDGNLDLVIGEYGVKTGTPTGKVRFFERNKDGSLKQSVNLQCNGQDITNRYTSPCVVDWNNDGKLDLILGSNSKAAQIFINKGSKESYRFDSFSVLKTVSGSTNSFPTSFAHILCTADKSLLRTRRQRLAQRPELGDAQDPGVGRLHEAELGR